MPRVQDTLTRGAVGGPMLGALGAVGLAVAVLALRESRSAGRREPDKRAALSSYLRDHLAGADAAIQIVKRLSETYQGSPEGALFGSLHERFREDRADLEALVTELDATPRSLKRLAGRATGHVAKRLAGGEPGDLSLFRTLEALAIGVQGKRCLWRAVQALVSPPHPPGRRSFIELETEAIRQWEGIEQCRRYLVPRTFAV